MFFGNSIDDLARYPLSGHMYRVHSSPYRARPRSHPSFGYIDTAFGANPVGQIQLVLIVLQGLFYHHPGQGLLHAPTSAMTTSASFASLTYALIDPRVVVFHWPTWRYTLVLYDLYPFWGLLWLFTIPPSLIEDPPLNVELQPIKCWVANCLNVG